MIVERPAFVDLVEVCPRDGLQNDAAMLSVETRIALVHRLARTGLRRIEAVSFVKAERVPQMADAEAVLDGLDDLPGVSLSGLVLNERGFERAAGTRLHEITFVTVASEALSRRNQGAGVTDNLTVWSRLSSAVAAAGKKRSVTIAAAFGCPFEGEVPLSRVVEIAREVAAIGTDELSLADTIGVATPVDVETRFAAVKDAVPGLKLRAHFHNTRNIGFANADAALRIGVNALDASLGSLGGCPFAPGASGNIATEDLAYMLDRAGIRHDGTFAAMRDATLWLETKMGGRRLPAQSAHVDLFPKAAA